MGYQGPRTPEIKRIMDLGGEEKVDSSGSGGGDSVFIPDNHIQNVPADSTGFARWAAASRDLYGGGNGSFNNGGVNGSFASITQEFSDFLCQKYGNIVFGWRALVGSGGGKSNSN